MKLQVLAKVIWDRWWLVYIYFLVTAITCIQVMFRSSLAAGAAALLACVLCFTGGAGFMGSLRGRHENNSSAKELIGITIVAVVLAAAGVALMLWSGFGLNLFGVAIEGPYWALVGVFLALIVTKKEDVQ